MRRKAKVDNNQAQIVDALRDIPGVTVALKHDDILVGQDGKTYWYEIKSETAISKKTGAVLESSKQASQRKLESIWTGHYRIVSSIDEILSDISVTKRTEKWRKA